MEIVTAVTAVAMQAIRIRKKRIKANSSKQISYINKEKSLRKFFLGNIFNSSTGNAEILDELV